MTRKYYLAAGLGLAIAGPGLSGQVTPGIAAPGVVAGDAASGNAASGARVYGEYCAACHGANLVNPGNGSFDLRAFPAGQHNRFIASVMNGKGPMPPWDGIVTPAQAEDLWAYVTAGPGSAAR